MLRISLSLTVSCKMKLAFIIFSHFEYRMNSINKTIIWYEDVPFGEKCITTLFRILSFIYILYYITIRLPAHPNYMQPASPHTHTHKGFPKSVFRCKILIWGSGIGRELFNTFSCVRVYMYTPHKLYHYIKKC